MAADKKAIKSLLLCSPVAAGHLSPLLHLARYAVGVGIPVTIAIAGDANEPANKHAATIAEIGAKFLNLDDHLLWPASATIPSYQLGLRVTSRAADCHQPWTEAVLSTMSPLPSVIIFDIFALWGWLIGKNLNVLPEFGLSPINLYVSNSGFPESSISHSMIKTPEVQAAIARFPYPFEPNSEICTAPKGVPVICFSSRSVAPDAPKDWHLVGLFPPGALTAAPAASPLCLEKYSKARSEGIPIVYLAFGTIILRFFGTSQAAFFREVYHTITIAALKAGAVVIASTLVKTPEELGIDFESLKEAGIADANTPITLKDGVTQIPRVLPLPFVPQLALFAKCGVDLFITHGGANSFAEGLLSDIPMVVAPFFGDQPAVALRVVSLGLGGALITPEWNGIAKSIEQPSPPDAPTVGHTVEDFAQTLLPELISQNAPQKLVAKQLGLALREEAIHSAHRLVDLISQ